MNVELAKYKKAATGPVDRTAMGSYDTLQDHPMTVREQVMQRVVSFIMMPCYLGYQFMQRA